MYNVQDYSVLCDSAGGFFCLRILCFNISNFLMVYKSHLLRIKLCCYLYYWNSFMCNCYWYAHIHVHARFYVYIGNNCYVVQSSKLHNLVRLVSDPFCLYERIKLLSTKYFPFKI